MPPNKHRKSQHRPLLRPEPAIHRCEPVSRRGGAAVNALALVVLLIVAVALTVVYFRSLDDRIEPIDTASLEFDSLAERTARAIADRRPERVFDDAAAFVQRHPEFALGHRLIGQIWYEKGVHDRDLRPSAWQSAQSHWHRSLELDPEQDGLRLLAGDLAMKRQEPQEAEELFAELVRRNPDNLTHSLRLAFAWINLGRFEEAERRIDLAARLDDRRYESFYLRGVLAGRRALDPEMDDAQRRSLLLEAIDHVERGRERLEDKVLEERERYITVVRHLAGLHRRLAVASGGDRGAAESALALLQPPTLFETEAMELEIVREIAQAYELLDRPERAAMQYQMASIRNPREWRLAHGAAKWWIRAGRLDHAESHLQRLRTLARERPGLELLQQRLSEVEAMFQDASPIPMDDLIPD
ncbi:MAG: tetratricopeptide repeat protein [Phycisphaeraceae bacterium]|nr:tetratricopeptide repeat protein [Phycisphaeraceae bacterium]